MDINDLRIIFTLLVFLAFIVIVWWAYSAKRKSSFDHAANSVFDEEDAPARGEGAGKQHN